MRYRMSSDPETKRKIIGERFIRIFEREALALGDVQFLAQGTLYPDVIESTAADRNVAAKIKTHHNVGGLPERMNLKLVEPLRYLFKDEVRAVGTGTRFAGIVGMAPPFPRSRPRRTHPGIDHPRTRRNPAPCRRDLYWRIAPGRVVSLDTTGIRGIAAGAKRRRHGRFSHLC